MGSSKSNTGIGFIDNPIDAVINKGLNPAAKTTEASAGRVVKSWGTALTKGRFDNFQQTLLEQGALLSGFTTLVGGAKVLEDIPGAKEIAKAQGQEIGMNGSAFKAGENNYDKIETEELSKAAIAESERLAADAKAAKDKAQNDINTVVESMVKSRRRQPGKAGTLLMTSGLSSSSSPLLTGKN